MTADTICYLKLANISMKIKKNLSEILRSCCKICYHKVVQSQISPRGRYAITIHHLKLKFETSEIFIYDY